MGKNLVIVESPAKAKTIEGYLGKDYTVKSSFGHVRDLPKGNNAIDVNNGYLPTYEISADKKDVVRELKKLAKEAETVWLATDDDREGEAISWHLKEALNLDDAKTRRIVFREITKNAILNAISNPREIDADLVNAQQARRVLDRLVGFELSPVLWKKIKRGLSAGRVQSVAVRLIVDRERDIEHFDVNSYFKITAEFFVEGKKILKAESGKKFNTEEEAQSFLESCVGQTYTITDLQKKPGQKKPAAPFTTSTLQQDAGRKFGFSVSQTMTIAQRLYESGKITYMRTDSVNLSEDAIAAATKEISSQYGNEYIEQRRYKTKSNQAQEAHEAIRPTSFAAHQVDGDRNEQRLYELIWKRAIASQMANAQTEKTTATIGISNVEETLRATGEVITFDGFLKVYLESTDDDDADDESKEMLPPLSIGQELTLSFLQARERFTRPPARYSEAALVKQLEEMGIGRPSTYAPTISTIQKRGYVVKENRDGKDRSYKELVLKKDDISSKTLTEVTGAEKMKLFPTDIAMIVNDFLVQHFPKVTDFSFTADIELEFDAIAHGKTKWDLMIDSFYKSFHDRVTTTENIDRADIDTSITLGKDPESGRTVLVRLGKFGPMAQIGTPEEVGEEEKPKYASLLKGQLMETITLDEALKLFEFPKTIGQYEGQDVVVAQGRFGPYVKFNDMFVSLARNEAMESVDMERAIELIEAKRKADAPIDEYEGLPVQKGVGRFGPFIKWNGMFINVNKKYDFDNLSHADIEELIEEKKKKEIEKFVHNWEDKGISVQKARWGRHVIVKNNKKLIELPKNVEVKDFTLEQVEQMIEEKAPAKKKKAPAKKKAKK